MSMTRCTISSCWCPRPSMPFLAAARSTSIVVPDAFAECTDVTERDKSEALELVSQSQLMASFFSLCVLVASFFSLCVASSSFSPC